MWINGKTTITIPNAKAGDIVEVTYANSGDGSRGLYGTNLLVISGTLNTGITKGNEVTATCSVVADGNVVLAANDGALYFYSLSCKAPGENDNDKSVTTYYNQAIDASKNQIAITLGNHDMRYYDTENIASINLMHDTVRITPKDIDGFDLLTGANNITFRKGESTPSGTFESSPGQVEITEARGWLESAYVKFNLLEGASSYNIYIIGGEYDEYTKIDHELVRNYGTYGRADMVGLRAGTYAMKVVPVVDGKELADAANEAKDLEVRNYLRTNFAHFNLNNTGVGAYNIDGTLKDGAKVFYVTSQTAKTITTDVITSSKGSG